MKKTLSLLLVLAMVLSSFTAFAGADTVAAEVQTHKAYIAGISDDTFAPKNNVTRQQVARMIAVANCLEKGTPEFKDADKISNWAKDSVGALQKAGIVVGDEKGNFNPKDEVKRSELAMMLVKAYENIHEDIEAKDISFKDVADDAWYAEAVKKAATVEIVAGVGNDKFNPNGNATREQAVAMVNRMLGLDKDKVENIDKLETKFKDVEEWSDWAKEDILLASTDFNYVEKDGKIVVVDKEELEEKAKVEEATKAVEKAEESKLEEDIEAARELVEALKDEEVKKQLNDRLDAIEVELKVVEVSAINPTTIKVTFNQEVEELAKADVVVTNVKTSEKQYVKEVKLAEDKKSAEISFYDALATKNTYKVVAAGAEKEFDFVIGDVAKIEAKTVQTVKAETPTAIEYKVLDNDGLDITAKTKVTFESTASDKIEDGKIKLADKETAFVYVVYTDKDGNKIKSNRITIKAEAAKPAEIAEYTVAETVKFDDDDYKQNLVLQKGAKGQKVHVLVKDQFGKKIDFAVSYESLDKTIALVDRSTGAITPLKEGSVPVRITVGDVTKTIEIKVVADAKAAAVELDKNEISISNQVQTPEEVKVTVKDQYDNVFETSEKLTVKVTSGSDLVTVANELSLTKGVGTLEVKPADKTKSGKAVIEIAVSEKVKTTLEVEVTEAGIVDNYVVEGFKAELDKNTDEKNKNKEMILSVFPVDANGVKTGDAVAATYEVQDKDGKEVKSVVSENKIEASNKSLEADETYTLIVKVGTIEVFKDSFKVVDTTKKPVIEQKTSNINIEIADGKINDELKAAFLKDGKALVEGENVVVKSSDNVNVVTVDEDGKATAVKQGKATLVISKVAGVEVDNLIVNVTIEALKGKATATASTVEGDNEDVNPLGSVIVDLTYGNNIKSADVESLKIELYNDKKLLATNILQPEKLNKKEKELNKITSPFNLGRSEKHDKWAWVRGEYPLKGETVTTDDLPNKVVATYVVNGITYVSEIELTGQLTVPNAYEATVSEDAE